MANDNKQLFAKVEDEEQDHLSETEKEFAEQQLQVPSETWIDFPHNERTQEARPQSAESQIGNWVHQYPEIFNESLSPPIPNLEKSDIQVPLPDPKGVGPTLYADLVDFDNQYIPEIKPNSPDAIEQGLLRNQTYEHRAEENFGGDDWASGVHTYNREELVAQNNWMDAASHQASDVAALDTTWPDVVDSDTLTPSSEVAALDTTWPDTASPNIESSADHDSDPNVTQTEQIDEKVVSVDTPESTPSTSEVAEANVPDASATGTADANGLDSNGTNSSASADTGMAGSGSSSVGDSSDSGAANADGSASAGAASADGSASAGAASADGSASAGAASADGSSSGVGDGGASGASGAADGGAASGASSGASGSSGAAGGANGGAGSAGY